MGTARCPASLTTTSFAGIRSTSIFRREFTARTGTWSNRFESFSRRIVLDLRHSRRAALVVALCKRAAVAPGQNRNRHLYARCLADCFSIAFAEIIIPAPGVVSVE
jgi:hypothetical protein